MAFTQLLAANRSLRNIRNGPSRYKMTQANLLPRFGPESEAGAGPAAMPPTQNRGGRRTVPGPMSAPATAPQFLPRLAQRQKSSWWRRLANPFGGNPKSSVPGPVQAELMLGLVQPVRNKLSFNDLELNPVQLDAASTLQASQDGPAVAPRVGWRRWVTGVWGRVGKNRA